MWLKRHPQTHPTDPIFITKVFRLFTGHPIRQPEYFGKKEWTGGVIWGGGFDESLMN
ncbi:hypothetical protein [Moraxella oculi]|uniref:Uncharacterized protein n=1 Tax=Moraxella oculi TaxID=2940516 RepID=A0ABW8UDI1_9GAMM